MFDYCNSSRAAQTHELYYNNHTWLITDAGGGYDSSTRPDGMLTVVAMATARERETETTVRQHTEVYSDWNDLFSINIYFILIYLWNGEVVN